MDIVNHRQFLSHEEMRTNWTIGPDLTTYKQGVSRGKTYWNRVRAFTAKASSAWSNTASITTP